MWHTAMSKGGDASGCGCHEKGNHPLMTIKRFSAFAALCLVVLTGCTHRQPLHQFAGLTPVFDPMRFWMGHTHSWGVIENRDGSPSEIVTTDCIGTEDGPNALRLHQQLNFSTGKTMIRDWRLVRDAAGHYVATANDMRGAAVGESAGPAFQWSFMLATKPGNRLFDVRFTQHMYAMPDGTLVNRTIVTKFGIVLAEVTEQFTHDR
jgi:hypothetical protein